MNPKTLLMTAAALLVAMTAVASPAQAVDIIGAEAPPIVVANPCDHMISPNPAVQQVIQACRNADNDLVGAVEAVVALARQQVNDLVDQLPGVDPNNVLPDFCSTQENVVPYALECAAWAILFISENVPGSDEIVALLNALLAQVTALSQWAQDYVLVDLVGWYDATSGQAAADIGGAGTWVLSQTGYSASLGAWADATADDAVGDSLAVAGYGTATAGQAVADAVALAAYVNCRVFSTVSCGNVPMPQSPGLPPVPSVSGNPPMPTSPPTPTAPGAPPTPSNPPI